jgi:hypothetical protein
MSILIDTLLEIIREEYKKREPEWKITCNLYHIHKEDISYLLNESKKKSEFDPMNIRIKMIEEWEEGKLEMIKGECQYGTIIMILDREIKREDIPWRLWGRILRLYCQKNNNKKCKIYILASSNKRFFPKNNEKIRPENINGGYTYTCNLETIMIYRAEDATRVLIHELQHSSCLDDKQKEIDDIEAETEAWAELLYIGLLSKGKKEIFNQLLKKQIEWMCIQNRKVKNHMKDKNSKEFPWRYTIGKEEVWKRWGLIGKEKIMKDEVGDSLRLTRPPDNKIKEEMKVSSESVLL